jgi:Transposase, Mutator family
VEETLNAMLDAEADRPCRAERYERTEARKDTRAGSYQRHLQTKAGDVTLKVPKLRNLPSGLTKSNALVRSPTFPRRQALKLGTSAPNSVSMIAKRTCDRRGPTIRVPGSRNSLRSLWTSCIVEPRDPSSTYGSGSSASSRESRPILLVRVASPCRPSAESTSGSPSPRDQRACFPRFHKLLIAMTGSTFVALRAGI